MLKGYFKGGMFHLDEKLKTRNGVVPEHFPSDGFSIPWFVAWFHPKFGQGVEAAIGHDCGLKNNVPKVHKNFRDDLLDYGIKPWKANTMYAAVVAYAYYKKVKDFICHLVN